VQRAAKSGDMPLSEFLLAEAKNWDPVPVSKREEFDASVATLSSNPELGDLLAALKTG